jgi:hypothetical protein
MGMPIQLTALPLIRSRDNANDDAGDQQDGNLDPGFSLSKRSLEVGPGGLDPFDRPSAADPTTVT